MKLSLRILGVLLVAIAVFAVAGIVATWAPDRSVESLKTRWAPAPSQFVAVQGMPVHLRDEGPRDDPTPIVLLHGTAASLHTWDGWAAALVQQNRRVIRFDLPAFGLTGPHPQADYSIAAYTRFVIAVLDTLAVPQVVLGGNSLGGEIAWATAVAAPARVQKLLLVDAGGYPFAAQSVPLGFQMARLPGVRWLMQHVLPRGVVEKSARSVFGDPSKVTPEMVDRYYELTLRSGNRQALGQRFEQLAQTHGRDAGRIKTLTQPTLVLWGGQDRLIPPDNAAQFARDIRAAKVVLFPALGHVPHEEDPTATVTEVISFLKP